MSVLVRDRLSTPRSDRRGLMGLGASAQESHPELLDAAETQAAGVGIQLECKEEIVASPELPSYYNRVCRAKCPSGVWTSWLFGADLIAQGGFQISILKLDVDRECGTGEPMTSQPPANQTGNSSTPPPAPTASIVNLTRGGTSFTVGDRFQLTIRGAANQPVTGTAIQNGTNLGTTGYGSTDASGMRVLTGTMDASTVGTWTEIWTVGGVKASPLSFVVSAGATPPKPPADQSGSRKEEVVRGSAGGRQGSGSTGGANNGGQEEEPALSIPDLIEQVPWWAWLVAGVGATYLATRRSGR